MRSKTKNEKQKRIIYSFQRNGQWVVEVPVSDNPEIGKAIINRQTWNRLMDLGMWPNLTVNKDGYVMALSPSKEGWPSKRLARLIADCNSDQEVRVKDGNELNLLEENLERINRDAPTNDRETFLSTEAGVFYNEVEFRTKGVPETKPYNDAQIMEALATNPRYQDWLHQQKGSNR